MKCVLSFNNHLQLENWFFSIWKQFLFSTLRRNFKASYLAMLQFHKYNSQEPPSYIFWVNQSIRLKIITTYVHLLCRASRRFTALVFCEQNVSSGIIFHFLQTGEAKNPKMSVSVPEKQTSTLFLIKTCIWQ